MNKNTINNISKTFMKNKMIVAVACIAIIIFAAASPSLSTISYTTAYQGAQPSFYGATFNGVNYVNGASTNGGHSTFSGTTMSFNAGVINGKPYPTITGEMTSVFIPTTSNTNLIPQSLGDIDIPITWLSSWTSSATANGEPSRTFEWKNNGKDYIMKEYDTKWYITLASTADQYPIETTAYGKYPQTGPLQLWFKLDTNENGWYFNGDGLRDTKFSIAKLLVTNAKADGRIANNVQYSPEVGGSTMSVYLNPFGQETTSDISSLIENTEGSALNPTYFRDSVYCVLNLDTFGSQDWYDWFAFKSKGDTLALEITVKQFVVGEWVVQDFQDEPTDYIKPSAESTWGWDIGGWFESIPWTTWAGLGTFFIILLLGLGALVLLWVFGMPNLKGSNTTPRTPPPKPKSSFLPLRKLSVFNQNAPTWR